MRGKNPWKRSSRKQRKTEAWRQGVLGGAGRGCTGVRVDWLASDAGLGSVSLRRVCMCEWVGTRAAGG